MFIWLKFFLEVLGKIVKMSQFYLTKVCGTNFFINYNFSFHCEVVEKSQIET